MSDDSCGEAKAVLKTASKKRRKKNSSDTALDLCLGFGQQWCVIRIRWKCSVMVKAVSERWLR